MIKLEELKNRLDPTIEISRDLYTLGLLNLVDFLIVELKRLMKKEDRFKGIVKIYLANMDSTLTKIFFKVSDKDSDSFCRILYLYKPLIVGEFRRLVRKRLSEADSVLTIIRKILLLVEETKDFKYMSETKTLSKLIGKLWDNIRHRAKNDPLYYLSYQIKDFMAQGLIGKFPLDKFTFEEPGKSDKQLLDNPGERGIDFEIGQTINL